jgi:SAM-dependent methyltransferase
VPDSQRDPRLSSRTARPSPSSPDQGPNPLVRFAYRGYHAIIERIRTSRLLHRRLFGYTPCPGSDRFGPYWDWATLAVDRALEEVVAPGASLLDVGTGHVAVLAIVARRRLGCGVVEAVDRDASVVDEARRNILSTGAGVGIACSDLFEHVQGRFDVLAFNAPYLDRERAHRLGVATTTREERRFCSDDRGAGTIVRFLREAPRYLAPNGVVVLGVNHFHIPRQAVREAIEGSSFDVRASVSRRWLPGTAYVLTPRMEGGTA